MLLDVKIKNRNRLFELNNVPLNVEAKIRWFSIVIRVTESFKSTADYENVIGIILWKKCMLWSLTPASLLQLVDRVD